MRRKRALWAVGGLAVFAAVLLLRSTIQRGRPEQLMGIQPPPFGGTGMAGVPLAESVSGGRYVTVRIGRAASTVEVTLKPAAAGGAEQRICAPIPAGHIARFTKVYGDGVLCVFGFLPRPNGIRAVSGGPTRIPVGPVPGPPPAGPRVTITRDPAQPSSDSVWWIPFNGGQPRQVLAESESASAVVVGQTLYWLRRRPEEKWWDYARMRWGYTARGQPSSQVVERSLNGGSGRVLASGMSSDTSIWVSGGTFCWAPSVLSSSGPGDGGIADIYAIRPGEDTPRRLAQRIGGWAAGRAVLPDGRICWLEPGRVGSGPAVRYSEDGSPQYVQYRDGNTQYAPLEMPAGTRANSYPGLLAYRGHLYLLASMMKAGGEPQVALCEVQDQHPARAELLDHVYGDIESPLWFDGPYCYIAVGQSSEPWWNWTGTGGKTHRRVLYRFRLKP